MEDRNAKLARVGRLRARLPYMTQSAFAALLAAAREEPLPDISRRDDVREARSRIARSQTPYGEVHMKIQVSCGRKSMLVEVAAPWPLLHVACEKSDGFSKLLLQVMDRRGPPSPSSPYKIGLYSDEITPDHGQAPQEVPSGVLEHHGTRRSSFELGGELVHNLYHALHRGSQNRRRYVSVDI